MISLIKADLYKIIKRKSFKFIVMLIVFVSVLSISIIKRNIDLNKEDYILFPMYSIEEYKSVNKYGSYKQYKNRYQEYEKVVKRENEKIKEEKITKSEYIVSYAHNFLFVLGVVIIYFSFNSFSYDYQRDTIRYLFMSNKGRKRIYLSKIISNIILIVLLELLLIIVMCITTSLLTSELLSIKLLLSIFKIGIIYFIPLMFISIFTCFMSILFKGSSLGIIISYVVYFSSLVFSQILFNYGVMVVKYTFLPYIDYTYLSDSVNVVLNNIIYNLNFSYLYNSKILLIYSLLFVFISLKLIKRDV